MQYTVSRRVDPYDYSVTAQLNDADIKKVFSSGEDPDDEFYKLFGPEFDPSNLTEAQIPVVLRLVADIWEQALAPLVNATTGEEVSKPTRPRK